MLVEFAPPSVDSSIEFARMCAKAFAAICEYVWYKIMPTEVSIRTNKARLTRSQTRHHTSHTNPAT
jgi:hypothetical protein